jgi:ABC-2 type transport system permease protein
MELILATYTLWRRDIVRFFRQRSRIVGALGTPVVFWVLLGSGLGSSFSVGSLGAPAGGYLEYFYPGTLALILLFTAIFSTISVIEDRHEGFLQGVMVAPIPRMAIVLGKILGGTTLALIQAALFLLLAPLANAEISLAMMPLLLVVLAVFAFALTGLGFVLAWILDSTQGFHAIMNLLLFPMWLLSGAVFPPDGAAGWIRVAMLANPMTYGVAALRTVLSGTETSGGPASISGPLTFIAVFGLITLALSSWSVIYRRT